MNTMSAPVKNEIRNEISETKPRVAKMIRVIVSHTTRSEEDTDRLIDAVIQLRAEAMKHPGYITGETLVNNSDPTNVLVVSTWSSEEAWNAWETSEVRTRVTRQMMLPLLKEPYKVSMYSFSRMQRGRVSSI